jgi:hypothetical protein
MDAVQVTNFSSLTAYGASPVLNTQDADIGNWNDLDEVFVRFPLAGVASGSFSGQLRLTVVSNPAGTTTSFELQEVEEDGFGELDSSWGFTPTPVGTVLDTVTVSTTGEILLDVGDSVAQALGRGDSSITYRLKRTGVTGSNPGCAFASRSHSDSTKRPSLQLTYAAGDSDADGISNEWEQRWFGGPEAAPAMIVKGGGTVPAHDVYVWGLDPTDADAVLEPLQAGPDGAGGFSLRVPTVTGRNYAVQFTDDLTQPGGGWQDLPGADGLVGDGEEQTVTDPNPGGGRCYRIRVWVP